MTDAAGDPDPEQARSLERLAAAAWPAETSEAVGGWHLGLTRGVTRRANSVLPFVWDGASLGVAIEEVERDNEAARALYDGLGYRHVYSYHYLVAPPPAAGA